MPGIVSHEVLDSLAAWLDESETRRDSARVEELLRDFDVNETARRAIQAANTDDYNVALQFPDSLIRYAPLVSEALRIHTEGLLAAVEESKQVFFFILGDTSYGECCVDEVAAQHLDAHLIVHYGNTCFSPTRVLPVSYVFPTCFTKDLSEATNAFRRAVNEISCKPDIRRIIVLYDSHLQPFFRSEGFHVGTQFVDYSTINGDVAVEPASLRVPDPQDILRPDDPRWTRDDSKISVGALAFNRGHIPMTQTAFLWITTASLKESWPAPMRNSALRLGTGEEESCAGVYGVSLTDQTGELGSPIDATRMLKKRLAVLNKIVDAERIGIVAGTLGISGNVEVIDRCRKVIERAGKRSYTVLVGKPNPTKLANFLEIDVFVLVACPYNTLIDASDYMQPIVTPLELEKALLADGDIFSTPYSTDFRDLLRQPLRIEDDKEPDGTDEKALLARGDWSVTVVGEGSAAGFLKGRSWQGLKYGQGSADNNEDVANLSTEIRQGQSGIASRYEKENGQGGSGSSNR